MDIKKINLGIRFLIEVYALIQLGYLGSRLGKESLMKLVLGIGLPVLFAFLWGMFASPAAVMPASKPVKVALEVTIFLLAFISLYTGGHQNIAKGFIILGAINRILMLIWER